MRRAPPLQTFSLSFIDLFSCAFGGMMLIMILFSIEQRRGGTDLSPTVFFYVPRAALNDRGEWPDFVTITLPNQKPERVALRRTTDDTSVPETLRIGYWAPMKCGPGKVTIEVPSALASDTADTNVKISPESFLDILKGESGKDLGGPITYSTIHNRLGSAWISKVLAPTAEEILSLIHWIQEDRRSFDTARPLTIDLVLEITWQRLRVLAELNDLIAVSAAWSETDAGGLLRSEFNKLTNDYQRLRERHFADRPLKIRNAGFLELGVIGLDDPGQQADEATWFVYDSPRLHVRCRLPRNTRNALVTMPTE